MKSKTLTIILSTALIVCIGVSIYQLNTTSALKNRLSVLTNTKNELTAEIENKTEELKIITSETEEINNTISELTTVMENLTSMTEEMQSEIKSLEEAKVADSDLSQEAEERIDAAMDEAIDNILKDYYKSNPQPTQPAQGNYESVGTPDSGQFTNPNYTVGESGSDGLADNVTVY